MSKPEYALPTTFSRRGILGAVSAASVLSLSQWPTRATAAGIDADGFVALSQKLVGQDDLWKQVATKMLDAFIAKGDEDKLAALVDGESIPATEADIVAAWYTGISPVADDLEVLTYTDALIWNAMKYTKPMGYCGGATGYWANPPQA